MIRAQEPISDPNVAAYYAYCCAFRVTVCEAPPEPWWVRLFLWSPRRKPVPKAKPVHCWRVGTTLFVTPAFRARMELYLVSYRLEARERRAACEDNQQRRTDGGDHGECASGSVA